MSLCAHARLHACTICKRVTQCDIKLTTAIAENFVLLAEGAKFRGTQIACIHVYVTRVQSLLNENLWRMKAHEMFGYEITCTKISAITVSRGSLDLNQSLKIVSKMRCAVIMSFFPQHKIFLLFEVGVFGCFPELLNLEKPQNDHLRSKQDLFLMLM